MSRITFLPHGPSGTVVGSRTDWGARITVRVDAADLAAEPNTFHTADVFPPDGSIPGLDRKAPVDVELRLDDEIAKRLPPALAAEGALVDELARRTEAGSSDELLFGINWYITRVDQGSGLSAVALHTVYDQARRVGRDLAVRDLELIPFDSPAAQPDDGLHDAVLAFLADSDHEELDDHTVRVPISGSNGPFDMFVHTPGQRRLMVYATYPEVIAPESRAAMGELVNRLNVKQDVAWLEFDVDRGVVSARAGLGVPDSADADAIAALADEVLGSALYALDGLRPIIDRVAAGANPVDAAAGIRKRLNLDDATAAEIADFFEGFDPDEP